MMKSPKSPMTGKEMILLEELREFNYKNKKIEILFECWRCEDTKLQFEDEKQAESNYQKIINKYEENN